MFQKMRCKRFKKEQMRREAHVFRLVGEVDKVTQRIHVSKRERNMNILSFDNARLFALASRLLSEMRDALSDIRTEESIHKLSCPNH